MDFTTVLLSWYAANRRSLPWRETHDPYCIWLSEIILQQTRVDQGISYYVRFLERFPSIPKLAAASEDEVLKLWQGLGYYSRARNLHFSARLMVEKFNGKFPSDYKEILNLRGVGEYTAAAIASIAYNQPCAAIDGNAYRVLSRVNGISEPIDSSKGKKIFRELADMLIDRQNPGSFNQAIMDLGATICTPNNPDCINCPVAGLCVALRDHLIDQLPVKNTKTKQRDRFFNYLIIDYKGHIYLEQRLEKDIWKGLFQFPLIETPADSSVEDLCRSNEWVTLFQSQPTIVLNIDAVPVHLLSHQKIHARFIHVRISSELLSLRHYIKVLPDEMDSFAIPKLIERYLSSKPLKN